MSPCRESGCWSGRARAVSSSRATATAATGASAGPFCEGWPIYHAVHDADSGTIYAAAASEWHGAGVWRSHDLGETWELSSDGLSYGDGDLKLSKISGLTVAHGRLLAGAEASGIFESRDGGVTWSLLSTLDGQPGRDDWNDPDKQPPGHLGLPAVMPHPDDPVALLGRHPGLRASSRRQMTEPPGLRATGVCAPPGRSRTPRSATACTSS